MMRIKLDPRLALFITVFSLLSISPIAVFATDISVNGSSCTLADAIAAANIDSAVAGCQAGSGADTITLTGNVTLTAALPVITSEITIEGAEYSVSGNDTYQVLVVEGGSLTLNDLAVTNGISATTGGGIYVSQEGSLTLNRSEVLDSAGNDSGGGIYSNNSDVTLNESEIARNTTTRSHGGGVYFISTTDDHVLDINRSSLEANTAKQDGGAVYLSGGNSKILKSSFFDNVGDEGGALEINSATLVVTNSTFGYNTAREGGGLSAFASNISLLHTTWAYNSAKEQGGGVALIGEESSLSILNTIIAGSPSGGDCHSGLDPDQIVANTSNIIEDGSCPLLTAGDKPPADSQAAPAEDGADVIASAQTADSAGAEGDETVQVSAAQSADGTSAVDDTTAQTVDEDSAGDQLSAQQDDSPPPVPTPIDPKLRPRTGWPPHFPLQSDSPAMNAADEELCESLELDEDQPGTDRPQGPNCEIGAWEAPVVPEPKDTPEPEDPEPIATITPTPIVTLPPPDEGPPPEACIHTVVRGDTLYGLALRYDTTLEAFRRFNQLESDSLSIGQTLIVPVENCDPDPYICVTPANVFVQSASGYVECADISTNRIDKHPALANGMIMAVEIRGYVNQGSEVCFPSPGNIVFLDTIASPPIVSTLTSYARSSMVCSQIDRPGIVVLVSLEAPEDAVQAEAVLPSFSTGISKELSDCEVTTAAVAQLLDTPGDGAVSAIVPFGTTLSAHERTADQFGVTYLDIRGWVNTAQVTTQGSCD